jgi:hypothetical protein
MDVSSEDDVAKLFYQSYAHMRVYMTGTRRQGTNWKELEEQKRGYGNAVRRSL